MEDHEGAVAEEGDNLAATDSVAGAAEHDEHGEDVIEEVRHCEDHVVVKNRVSEAKKNDLIKSDTTNSKCLFSD